MPYPEEMVAPMRAELVQGGFTELKNVDDVNGFFDNTDGTALLVVNSVCGCAAGSCRPGVLMSLENENKPDRLVTVFAGQDVDATAQARTRLGEIPPSSPSLALFKGGQLVHFIPRHFIEICDAQRVSAELNAAYNKFFAAAEA